MTSVSNIYTFLDKLAPFNTAMSFDNCGLLVGDMQSEVKACVLALDMTNAVLDFALENNAKLIITHHPVIFDPIKSVLSEDIVYDLIRSDVYVISSHTNLDLADNGVNCAFAECLGLLNVELFENEDNIGRVGALYKAMTPLELASHIKQSLNSDIVKYTDFGREIKSVAIVGGEGSDYLYDSKKYDAYITGEVKHHIFSYAQNAKIQLFVAGHYETEAVILNPLKAMLEKEFGDVDFFVYDKSDVKSL